MSLLYKEAKDVNYKLDIKKVEDSVKLYFSADCGKFGTDEPLDEFYLSNEELLTILQNHFDELKYLE